MKISISLSASGSRFSAKQRILLRLAKNEWYAATVRRVGKQVSALADNGETFMFDLDEPTRYVKIVENLKVFKKPLSDEQVKNILAGVGGTRAREAKAALPKAIQAIFTKFKVTSIEKLTVALFKSIISSLDDSQAVAFKRFVVSATKANPKLNMAAKQFAIQPKRVTVKVVKKLAPPAKPLLTAIKPSGPVLKLQDVYLPEVDEFHDTSIPDEFASLVKFSENSDSDMETRIKIAADSVAKLRTTDVFRVLQENKDVLSLLAAYIVKHRPDLKDEVQESLDEIG